MKKAQAAPYSGSSVAIFILLMGLFLAVFVLLLPPEEREMLLYQNLTENKEESKVSESLILEQSPGVLRVSKDDEIIHKIGSINLYSKEEPKITDLAASLYLEMSLFSETKRNLMFNINDLENLESVNLVFSASESRGNLVISINGIIIYDNKVLGLENIVLPRDILQKNNNIEFSLSSPGINLFGKNVYRLSNIKIRESYELTNTRESREIMLSDQETGDGELSFFLYCNSITGGSRLRIFINNEEIKNEVISCTTIERKIEISKNDIDTGTNSLMFQIDKGDYIFNEIELNVKTEFNGAVNYKFPITENQYDDVLSDDKEAILYMEFNDDEMKKATISVNGNEFSLDTDEIDYEVDISRLLKENNNFIKIIPLKGFNIDLLRITLE